MAETDLVVRSPRPIGVTQWLAPVCHNSILRKRWYIMNDAPPGVGFSMQQCSLCHMTLFFTFNNNNNKSLYDASVSSASIFKTTMGTSLFQLYPRTPACRMSTM